MAAAAFAGQAQTPLPNRPGSLKFAAIGDNGTGDRPQYEVAEQMTRSRATFPFDLVIMLGDNMYGGQRPADFVRKFEQPYAALLSAGVRFQASLGNHDRPENVSYRHFNMNGERYYTYVRNNVRFFALDTTSMDAKQVAWIDASLQKATEEWKICYFHHPLYSNARRHGSSVDVRVLLEPIFVKHGVNVVFAGHDHVYERLKPQKGIYYFVSGAAGQLRRGNMDPSDETAAYFDQDQSFMLVEIAGSELFFQAVSRTGKTVDSGVIRRQSSTSSPEEQYEPAAAGAGR
jgi:3',5'-cyclic AMP phosphodiesterase CpdA